MMIHKFQVNNIKCGGCASSIEKSLLKIEGIDSADVQIAKGEVTITCKEESDLKNAKSTLSKMGYPEDDPNMLQNAKSYINCMIGRIQTID